MHFRIAIVGTGSISHHFAKSIADIENATLVGVCSSTPQRADKARESFGVEAYHDVETMLEDADIDVVCVCTESGNHLPPTLLAAKAGKHVICEKPLEVTTQRAQQMIDACRENGVKLACVFQNRYSNDFQKLKGVVEAGMLGKLLVGNAYIKWFRDDDYYAGSNWRGTKEGDGGAALINQGIHTVDLLLAIMGDPTEVYAKVKTMTHDIEGEDVALAMLSFANGAMGTIEASTSMWPGYPERLEIFGEKGSVILEAGNIIAWNIQGVENKPMQVPVSGGSGSSDPMAISYHLHRKQIQGILESIANNEEPEVNGEEGLRAVSLIEAVYQSSKEKKVVRL